jgi:lipopolysaccharide export system protein LptC
MDRVITAQNDPETARAYWTMSRGDSDRAFRTARRHSRAVRFMRVTIPMLVVLLLGGFALAAYLNPLRALAKLPVNVNDLVVSGTKITMEKPRMTGFTKDARAYEFHADAAAQDLTKPDIVELQNIRAKLQMQDESIMDMSADAGVYDTKREMLELNKNIVLLSSNGNKGKLSQATIDVKKGNVVSNKPVELEFLQGVLNANKLEIVDSGDKIVFHDGVTMQVMLNDTALPQPGAAPAPSTPHAAAQTPAEASAQVPAKRPVHVVPAHGQSHPRATAPLKLVAPKSASSSR